MFARKFVKGIQAGCPGKTRKTRIHLEPRTGPRTCACGSVGLQVLF